MYIILLYSMTCAIYFAIKMDEMLKKMTLEQHFAHSIESLKQYFCCVIVY